MRKLEWGKFQNKCTVCGTLGHNRRSCPKVPEYAEKCKEIMASGVPVTQIDKPYVNAYKESELRKTRKPKKPKGTRKCSFCKLTNHTRRNCPAKEKYRDLLYEANRVWRRSFLEDIKAVGFGEGMLLKITLPPYKATSRHVIGIMTHIPWESMTFMAMYSKSWEYQTDLKFEIQASSLSGKAYLCEEEINTMLKSNKFALKRGISFPKDSVTVLAPSTNAPPPSWPELEAHGIEWLIKDHSASILEDKGIIKLAREIIKLFP